MSDYLYHNRVAGSFERITVTMQVDRLAISGADLPVRNCPQSRLCIFRPPVGCIGSQGMVVCEIEKAQPQLEPVTIRSRETSLRSRGLQRGGGESGNRSMGERLRRGRRLMQRSRPRDAMGQFDPTGLIVLPSMSTICKWKETYASHY